jgi:hypothetical protein
MNVRGRVVWTHRAVHVAPQVSVGRTKPRIIVYVKTGSRRQRDDWTKAKAHLGLDAIELQDFGYNVAFDVCGLPAALEELTQRSCVLRWEYVLDCRVGQLGAGTTTQA